MMMNGKESEYKEIFLAEALDNVEEVNRLLTVLEKSKDDRDTINALFRITHTLKGNASGMGYTAIAEMAHVLEDLFGLIREGNVKLQDDLFTVIYKAADTLIALVNAIRDGSSVKHKGIKTKIEVLINRARNPVNSSDQASTETHTEISKHELISKLNEVTAVEEDEEEESDSKVTFSDLVQVPV